MLLSFTRQTLRGRFPSSNPPYNPVGQLLSFPFTREQTEARREGICPRSQGQEVMEPPR